MSIGKHTAFNLVGAILPLAISLITIPIYLNLIGADRYGVLAITWLLLGYFGLFDLGLGRATAQRVGALRTGTVSQRATAFWTALLVNLGAGILGGLIIWPVAYYVFDTAVTINANLRTEIVATVPWLALAVPFATLSGVLSGALMGREKFLELNIISVIGAALIQLLPLFAVMIWGPELTVIIPCVLFSRVLSLLALFNRCLRHVCPGHRVVFEVAEATRLVQFGGWVTVTSMVGPMMVILDRIIIGIISGAAAVSLYTIPFQLGERTTILARSAASALFPRLSGLEEIERAKMARKGQNAVIAIITPISVIGILLIEPFFSFWISPEFSTDARLVAVIILAGFWANSFAVIPYALIQARGRPDLVAKLHLAEVLPYFVMLYLGIKFLGLPGAALAFSIRTAADSLLLSWIAGQLRSTITMIIVPALIMFVSIFTATIIEFGSMSWIAISVIVINVTLIRAWQTIPRSVKNMAFSVAGRLKEINGAPMKMSSYKEIEAEFNKPWETPWPLADLEHLGACPACDKVERTLLHADLVDNTFFCAPGMWQLWRCGKCQSAYIDPRPTAQTVEKAYKNYYTHGSLDTKIDYQKLGRIAKIRRYLSNGYTRKRYACPDEPASVLGYYLACFFPILRRIPDRIFRNIPRPESGKNRLLDIGCGEGGFLLLAKTCGWDVQGIDPDPVAVSVAQSKGLNVSVADEGYFANQTEIFDVITLSHVIEHVHAPKRTIERCFNLLKPGGFLWIETPNINGFGHQDFDRNWRGLETPRHLTIFSRDSLHRLLTTTGFHNVRDLKRQSPTLWSYKVSNSMNNGKSPFACTNLPFKLRVKAKIASGLGTIFPNRREFLTLMAKKMR